MAKIYVASSWRNKYYPEVVQALRARAALRPQRPHRGRMDGRCRQEGGRLYPRDGGAGADV